MADRLTIAGHAIEVRWWNSAQTARRDARAGTAPLVLLHEGLGSIALWRDFPPALADRAERPVFAYSRAGHGASDAPETARTCAFMHEEAIAVLPSVLEAAGIDDALLLGHSDGASIALIFAATYPARVRALILEAPHVFVEDVSIRSIERTTLLYQTGDLRARLAKYHSDVDAAFHGWSDVWLDPGFRAWNLEEYLPRITCPTLLMQGEQDEYGTINQIDAIRRQLAGPVETLILPDCGHSPHRDQPDAVLTAVVQFLRTIDI